MARSKSTRITRREPRTGDSLLKKLTDNPHLPAYIQKLPAPTLSRLIGDIGLEDSQEILALVSAPQMKAVLSVALWSGARPGQEEAFDLDQFIRWIDLWMQDGAPTLVRRVLELGEDFVVMCLSKLLTAVDRTTEGVRESGVEIGQYVLFPKQEKHWHRVVELLTMLWHHEPDFVLHALGRCSFRRSILNDDAAEHIANESLYEDMAAERSAERAGVGYVNPAHAAMFLMTAKTTDLRELLLAKTYDLSTADYLRKQRQLVQRVEQAAATPAADEQDAANETAPSAVAPTPESPARKRRGEARKVAASGGATQAEDFAAMDALLRDAGVLEEWQPPVALLTDQSAPRPRAELLEATLAELARQAPAAASRRMGELGYLSNVLMSGAEIQGKAFSEAEAAKVALATANLGLTYLLFKHRAEPGEAQRALQLLAEDPGTIRLFQIGYHLLCALPARCAEAVYRAKDIVARRPGHVVIMEMHEVLGASRLTDRIHEGLYGEAKSLIDGLSAVMESAACVALRRLIDPTPCFPRVLDASASSETIYVDKGYRHISTLEDIERIAEFLKDLASYCGN